MHDEPESKQDAQLRQLLNQLQPPAPSAQLLPRLVRTSVRTSRLASIGAGRRGFAFGAVAASVVFALLVLTFMPNVEGVRQIREQASAWLFSDDLIVSKDTKFWSKLDDSDSLSAADTRFDTSTSKILNLTAADIRSQDVMAIVNVPMDLQGAVVRVSLDSGIELRDLPGVSLVQWHSDFSKGKNLMNLSLETIDKDIGRFSSVQVRVSHPDYSTEFWINIANKEHI
ncbi:MAG: hypothetical protein K8963_09490 [Proteobacteria bacterium]|nr:hypothetical protein [Pseudomonadota bacterium]